MPGGYHKFVQATNVEHAAGDPLGYAFELPLELTVYPLGFPLIIRSNAAEVVEAARESWDWFSQQEQSPAMRLHVAVSVEPGFGLPAPPVFRAQRHLLAMVSDAANFAVCDLDRAFAFCRLAPEVAAAREWMRYHFLEAFPLVTLTHLCLTSIHAACVARGGRGVLLCGESGRGKSTLAYACARAGWTLVADDVAFLRRGRDDRELIGRPHPLRFPASTADLFPELRRWPVIRDVKGQTLIELPVGKLDGISTAARAEAHAVVFLRRPAPGAARLVEVDSAEVIPRLLREIPRYEDRVHGEHRDSLRSLGDLPARELHYRDAQDAVALLEPLIE